MRRNPVQDHVRATQFVPVFLSHPAPVTPFVPATVFAAPTPVPAIHLPVARGTAVPVSLTQAEVGADALLWSVAAMPS